MTWRAAALLPAALFILIGSASWATDWYDALAARVNGRPLLLSEVDARELLFGSGKPLPDMPPDRRDAAIAHAVDNRLLLAEAERFGVARPTDAAVADRLRAALRRAGTGVDWPGADALAGAVREELWVDAFVEARIRAFVLIRDDAVTQEVARQNGPQPGESGAAALARVRAELESREAAARLSRYLDRLRSRAEIRRYPIDLP